MDSSMLLFYPYCFRTTNIFLAHAEEEEDKEEVFELYEELKNMGYAPWLKEKDLQAGQNSRAIISKAIKNSDICIACFSTSSVIQEGDFQKDLKMALNRQADKPPEAIYLIPLCLEECIIPNLRHEEYGVNILDIQAVNLFEEDGYDKLEQTLAHISQTEYEEYTNTYNSEFFYTTAATTIDSDSYYVDYGLDLFDFIKWGAIGVLGLGVIGSITQGGENYGPSQPGGIVRSQKVIVTPKYGNCQPLRTAANEQSDNIGCVREGKELIAISDELQSGWIKVTGSANGTGWMFYEGLSLAPANP